jgi:hypothetical protein
MTSIPIIQQEKRYIVVDQNRRPMAFHGNQFCYVPIKVVRVGRPTNHILETYTESEALELIRKTQEYRRDKLKLIEPEDKYELMPIKI